MACKALIKLISIIDGERFGNTYEGEYLFENGRHCLSYSEKTENGCTHTKVEAGKEALTLKRKGDINSKMIFDTSKSSTADYGAYGATGKFCVNTYVYETFFRGKLLNIRFHYGLDDMRGNEIKCIQRITAEIFEENL